jgi:hypothetical protein
VSHHTLQELRGFLKHVYLLSKQTNLKVNNNITTNYYKTDEKCTTAGTIALFTVLYYFSDIQKSLKARK